MACPLMNRIAMIFLELDESASNSKSLLLDGETPNSLIGSTHSTRSTGFIEEIKDLVEENIPAIAFTT